MLTNNNNQNNNPHNHHPKSGGRMHGQNSVRLARNVAEKQRRDRLNSFINDLANTVPLVASATRRLDKTSILRLSAAYLRLHDSPLNVVNKGPAVKYNHNNCCGSSRGVDGCTGVNGVIISNNNSGPSSSFTSSSSSSCSSSSLCPSSVISSSISSCLTGPQLHNVMARLDGFVVVVNSDFKLIYVSETCEKFLGHQNIDMLGHQLSSFLHPGDLGPVRQAVFDLKSRFLSSGKLQSERISFRCRIRERAQPRTEVVTYQIVKISGFFQIELPEQAYHHHHQHHVPDPDHPVPSSSVFSPKFLSKNLLFKGFAEIVPANPILSLMDANQEEYVSRISLDGTLLYADHRISLVLGYMPSEVVGKSAYKFILVSDHVISLFAHKLMLSSSNGTGCVVHRLKNRSGGYTYLQSAGCLQYDRYTGKVDHFVNVARMLPEAEGKRELEKFIRKFAPHVVSDSPSTLFHSLQMAIAPSTASGSFPNPPPIPFEELGQQQMQQQQLQQQHFQQQQQLQQCQAQQQQQQLQEQTYQELF